MHLLMIRGPAAAGKSVVAKALVKKLGKKTALIEMDHLYYQVLQNELDHELVLECATRMADTFLREGYTVVLEGVFTVPYDKKRHRLEHDKLYNLAKKYGIEMKIIFLDISLEKAITRDRQRHGSKKLRREFITKLHEKTHARRHNQDIEIDTSHLSVNQVVNLILKRI